MESVRYDYSVGMRFRMRFEGEEGSEQRFTGTIIGLEDVEPVRWPGSNWRYLKVQWDETSNIPRPDRVSPWKIEPLAAATSLLPKTKKARANQRPSSPELPALSREGMYEPTPYRNPGVLQGQEIVALGPPSNGIEPGNAQKLLPSHWVPPPGRDPCWERNSEILDSQRRVRLENWPGLLRQGPAYWDPHSGDISSFPNRLPEDYWLPAFSTHVSGGDIRLAESRCILGVDSSICGFEEWKALKPNEIVERPVTRPVEGGMCKVFGVNLVENLMEPISPHFATSGEARHSCRVLPAASQSTVLEFDQLSEPSKNSKTSDSSGSGSGPEKSRKAQFVTRSCTKVHKQGTALGRSVDLTKFDGYEELVLELDRMFDFEGALLDPSKGWRIIYTDHEGDIMLVGDYPWPDFCSMVRKMFIYPREEVDKIKPNSLNPKPCKCSNELMVADPASELESA